MALPFVKHILLNVANLATLYVVPLPGTHDAIILCLTNKRGKSRTYNHEIIILHIYSIAAYSFRSTR